ncbi:lysophospholipid acyltransferase family protein [Desulfoplanes sp.]
MLRSIYAYTTITLYLVFGGLLLIPAAYLDRSGKVPYAIAASWARFCLHACGISLDVHLENHNPEQRYIFVSNHQSQVDIPILLSLLSRFRISFLAKHTLFGIPVLGRVMRSLGCVPIDRTNPRKSMRAVDQAIKRQSPSASFLVFPEGTRNHTLGGFKSGAVVMALRSKLPIVPVVIDGSGRVLAKNSLRIKPGTVRVWGLHPIEFQGNSTLAKRERIKQDIWNLMNNKLLESSQ